MKLAKELRYTFHVLTHPFDGFWDLKREKRGSLAAALIWLAAAVITYVFTKRYTGFIFNTNNTQYINVISESISVVAIFFLWVVANWSLTTLMDGNGTFKDIVIFSGYALAPYTLLNLAGILLSQFVTLEEGAIYYILIGIGWGWSLLLLVLGTLVTHDYTVAKTLGTIIMVIVAMMLIVFLALMVFSVVQQIITLVLSMYREITFRM